MMKRFLTFSNLVVVALFVFGMTQANAQVDLPCGVSTAFSDPGGPAGLYANNSNTIVTYCPEGAGPPACPDVLAAGQVATVTMNITSFDTETGWDAFYIYNGPTTASPLYPGGGAATTSGFPAGGFQGTTIPTGNLGVGMFRSTDPTGCITTWLRSDASVQRAGYVGTVVANPYTDTNANGAWTANEALVACPAVGPAEPCVLNCSGDINISLSGCNAYTIPDKIDLAWLTGNCPQVLLPESSDFTGAFDYAARIFWTAASDPAYGNLSCTDLSGMPTTLTLSSADLVDCTWYGTLVGWNVPLEGQVSFDWTTSTTDPGWDFFGYSTSNDPNSPTGMFGSTLFGYTVISDGNGSGSVTIDVDAGDIFSIASIFMFGLDPIVARITNFEYAINACPSVVQLQGPAPGTEVPSGIYNMKFEGLSAIGESLGKCTFKINVTAVQPNLTCNDALNISVNETCRVALVPDMLLENYEALGPCVAGDFVIKVWPFGDETQATGNVNGIATAFPLGTHTYEIVHPYGQKCWGTFTVEDKLAPRIDCGPIRDIFCYQVDALLAETLANARFRPTWADNCGSVVAEFTTHKLLTGCTGGNILRKWLVTDASGNTAYCEQWFRVNPVVQWSCPAPLVELTCKDATDPASIALAKGVDYGFPYFTNGAVKVPVDGVCNYYATYSDTEINACAPGCYGNKKVIREWKVLDWCTGTIKPCTQIIKAVDSEAPTFILKDTIVSTAPWYCEGDFFVPNPWELHDNCDINPTWTVKSGTVGVTIVPALLNGQPHPKYKYRAVGAPKGVSHLKYTAVDCCGNEVTIVSNVTVVDKTPPVPVAKRDVVIGLVPGYDANGLQDGQAKLFIESINNGSYDNCSAVRIEIRRPAGSPDCGNLGNGNPKHNNNVTFNNLLPANLANNMPYNANDTDGGEYVKFCCADLTTAGADFDGDGVLDTGYHQVIMRVWDDANMDGKVGNNGDNWNETWANVKVECKVAPVITCPADATINCDWPIEKFPSSSATKSIDGVDFTKTGVPTAYGVCTNPAISFRDKLTLNQCGVGVIERTFVISEKGLSRTCVQIITVLPTTSGQEWEMTFPSDFAQVAQVSCDGPTPADIKAKGPSWVAGPCDVIGVSTKVTEINFEDGVCKKWRVEYSYENWCDNEKMGPFEKTFMYSDLIAPEFPVCRDTMYAVDANCELRGLKLTKVATDEGGCIDNGWIKWTVFVDLWADGTNDYEFTSFIAAGNDVANAASGNVAAIRDDNGNGVKDIYVAPTSNGSAVTITIPEIIGGNMSNHKIVWKATDGCHNFTACHESFMVVDKKAPTPICVPLSTALMQDPDGAGPFLPMVELWAIDFMNKASDNCTLEQDLLFTFENVAPQIANVKIQGRDVNVNVPHYFNADGGKAAYPARENNAAEKAIRDQYLRGENGLQLWNPVTRGSAKVWTSTSLIPGQDATDVDVKVTVWDTKFNHDFCWTTLKLIINTTETGSITGTVATAEGKSVNNVTVLVDANATEFPKAVVTAANGQYSFASLNSGLTFEVTASKGGDYTNGVSTLDLVLIQRHILGLQPLTDAYKMIAADANSDGKITASDLTDLRKLILGINTTLANNQSWRFPVASQTLDIANPFSFVETITVATPNGEVSNQDFVAVKIGDVNGNVNANVANPGVEARTSNNVGFVVAEQGVEAGETVEIPVTASNFNEVFGYQFTMNLNGASFVGVQSGAIEVNANNVGVLAGNVMTMSYASNESVTAREDETLFTLVLRAEKATNVSEMMSLNSTVTASESYVGNSLNVGNVSLNVRTATVASIELFQNEPNPFKGSTTVSFDMPSATPAVITVMDVTGKLITVRNVNAVKGINSEIFTKDQLGASGVLYYTLTSGDFTATKKMIIVE